MGGATSGLSIFAVLAEVGFFFFFFLKPPFKIGVFCLKSRFLVILGKVKGLSINAHIPTLNSSGEAATASSGRGCGLVCSSGQTRPLISWTCWAPAGV